MRQGNKLKIAAATVALALALAPAADALKSNGKTVRVTLTCTGTPGTTSPADGVYGPFGKGTATGCQGKIILRGKLGGKRAVLGSATFSLARGQSKAVTIKLSGKARRALDSLGKLKARVSIASPSALTAPKRFKIKLKQPPSV